MNTELLTLIGLWLALSLLAAWMSAAAYPLVARLLRGLSPARRSALRFAYITSAPLVALAAVLVVSQPAISGLAIPFHCHKTQCGHHAPVYADDSLLLIGLALALTGLAGLVLVILLRAVQRGHKRLQMLSLFTRGGDGYRTLDSPDIVAYCVGLWRSEIVLSRGLLDQLQADELKIILTHEQAHVKRLDNLRTLLVRWSTLCWPNSLAKRAIDDVHEDAEQACDLAAVSAVAATDSGVQRSVASAKVADLLRRLREISEPEPKTSLRRGVSFDWNGAAQRLHALDAQGDGYTGSKLLSSAPCIALPAAWLLQVCLLVLIAHPVIEWLG